MTNESANSGRPPSVDRTTFQAELDKLRARAWRKGREDVGEELADVAIYTVEPGRDDRH